MKRQKPDPGQSGWSDRQFFKKGLNHIVSSLSSLVFPPLCLHCKDHTAKPDDLFCSHCAHLLELINPEERCPRCFSSKSAFCTTCNQISVVTEQTASAFDYLGPAASLIKSFKYGGQIYLGEGIAAYLAAQFARLDWPFPDRIVPVPMAWTHRFQRGFNQTEVLATHLSTYLGAPVDNCLARNSDDYSQAGLSSEQRLQMEGDTIRLKQNRVFKGETVLLIDDVMTTGRTLQRCAEVLLEAQPRRIYGLVFCRA
jgi:ComF family protein